MGPMVDMDTTTLHTPTPTLPTPTAMCTPTTVSITMDTTARERPSQLLRLRLTPRLTLGYTIMVLAMLLTHMDMAIMATVLVMPDMPDITPTPTTEVAETDTELMCLALLAN